MGIESLVYIVGAWFVIGLVVALAFGRLVREGGEQDDQAFAEGTAEQRGPVVSYMRRSQRDKAAAPARADAATSRTRKRHSA